MVEIELLIDWEVWEEEMEVLEEIEREEVEVS